MTRRRVLRWVVVAFVSIAAMFYLIRLTNSRHETRLEPQEIAAREAAKRMRQIAAESAAIAASDAVRAREEALYRLPPR